MLRKYAVDYHIVNHANITYDEIRDFFNSKKLPIFEFENTQVFDLASYLGRIESSSYMPKPNTEGHLKITQIAEDLFNRYEINGVVKFEYVTRLYLGQFSS